MRFRLNGETFELTTDEVRRRLPDVKPEPVRQLGVRVDGRVFPVKQAFEAATGVHRRELISHTARRHLAALGFELVGDIQPGSPSGPTARNGRPASQGGLSHDV
jgi:hypothetical protein